MGKSCSIGSQCRVDEIDFEVFIITEGKIPAIIDGNTFKVERFKYILTLVDGERDPDCMRIILAP